MVGERKNQMIIIQEQENATRARYVTCEGVMCKHDWNIQKVDQNEPATWFKCARCNQKGY